MSVLAACSSCHAPAGHGTVLVALSSPHGEYLLCRRCLGRDAEPSTVRTLAIGRATGGSKR